MVDRVRALETSLAPSPDQDQRQSEGGRADDDRNQELAGAAVVRGVGRYRAATVPRRHVRSDRLSGFEVRGRRGRRGLDLAPRRKLGRLPDRAASRIERDPAVTREVDLDPGVALLPGHVDRVRGLVKGARQVPLDVAGGIALHPHQHRHRGGVLLAEPRSEDSEAIHRRERRALARDVGDVRGVGEVVRIAQVVLNRLRGVVLVVVNTHHESLHFALCRSRNNDFLCTGS